ncbi:MAG: hypothetical protein IT436_13515 [Phycisphaerales bacterium]|nr:hypothetical protein [Phycisphaerales bacterium]
MNRRLLMFWLLVVGLSTAALTVAGRGTFTAHERARVSVASFRGLSDRVQEFDRLKARAAPWPPRSSSEGGLAQEISAVLTAASLPASAMTSLSPDNGTTLPGDVGLTQLRAGLTLNNITLPQLGRFLAQWRRRQPALGGWTVTAIDLSPEAESGKAAAPGATARDLPLRAVMNLESIVAEGAEQ